MRRGVAPSLFPTAGTTFPLDTLLFNASLFSFSRGQLIHSLRHAFSVPSQHATGMLAYSRRLSGGVSAMGLAMSETCTKAETSITYLPKYKAYH